MDLRPIRLFDLAVNVIQEDVHVLVEGQSFGGIVHRELSQFGDHPLQSNIAELHRVIGLHDVLIALGEPTSANVSVVPGKVNLFDILMIVFAGVEVLLQQSRLEFTSTLIDGNGMSNMLCSTGHLGQVCFGGEGQIEVSYRVDGVEQAKEMHLDVLTTKSRSEALHPFSIFGFRFEFSHTVLIILVGFIGKGNHLFVALGQHPDGGNHPGEETGGEGATGEAKEEDFVPILVVSHDEAIGGDDVGIKGGADALIDHLRDGSLETSPHAGIHRFVPGCIGSNAGCKEDYYQRSRLVAELDEVFGIFSLTLIVVELVVLRLAVQLLVEPVMRAMV